MFHLAAFIVIHMFIDLDSQNTTYCFSHDSQGSLISETGKAVFDQKVLNMKWTHLAIFLFEFGHRFHFTNELDINMSVITKFLKFVTVPIYWFVIIDAFGSLRKANLNVLESTTSTNEVRINSEMPFCV